jgi:hypothetical protein
MVVLLISGHLLLQGKCDLIREVVSLAWNLFYDLTASEMWPDKRGDL